MRQTYVELVNNTFIPQNRETAQNHSKKNNNNNNNNQRSKMDSIEKAIRSWTMRNLSMVGKNK